MIFELYRLFMYQNVLIFGQLIEYNTKDIFVKELYTKCGGETISRLFPKK